MKKFSTKASKKIVAIVLAAVTAFSVMGCGTQNPTSEDTSVTEAPAAELADESQTEAVETTELVTYEFETYDNVNVVIDENSIIAQEPSEDPEYSELVSESARGNVIAPGRDFVYLEDDYYYYVADISRQLITVADKSKAIVSAANTEETATEVVNENPGFFETDSWSITYDNETWYGYVNEEGNTIINYLGECAGTSLIEISEVDVASAKDVIPMLEEKKGKELTVIDALEGEPYTCNVYAADEVYDSGLYIADFYTLYEHNGKVIIVDESVTHDDDDARAEALADIFAGVKKALVLK